MPASLGLRPPFGEDDDGGYLPFQSTRARQYGGEMSSRELAFPSPD
jgi:hypothetical protein